MKNVIITGVSTGIGYSITELFIQKGYRVFGSVRKDADAQRLSKAMGENFIPLLMDVTDETAISQAAVKVKEVIGNEGISALVNNAGIAVVGALMDLELSDIRRQFEVNVLGVLAVTKAFMPLLGIAPDFQGKPGKIINISSVNGKLSLPFIGPYCSSKHALEGFSNSLRRELWGFGVDVVLVAPGPVKTPIWDKKPSDESVRGSLFEKPMIKLSRVMGKQGEQGLAPERVAKLVLKVCEARKPKTRYTIVPNYLKDWWVPMRLPERRLDSMVGKMLGLKSKS